MSELSRFAMSGAEENFFQYRWMCGAGTKLKT